MTNVRNSKRLVIDYWSADWRIEIYLFLVIWLLVINKMTSTTHALIGAALGKSISNPWLIIIIAIPLHYILDMFRHGEYVETMDSKTNGRNAWWKIVLDISIGFSIIAIYIFTTRPTTLTIRNMALGVFFSMFPDLLTLIYWKTKSPFLEKIYKFHVWCHRFPRGAKERLWTFRNTINDIIFSAIAIILLFI